MTKEAGRFTFITGGRRSGKSSHALELAKKTGKKKLFIATAIAYDSEMMERISRHKKERGAGWRTIEEPVKVAKTLNGLKGFDVAVIDCLTLWLFNITHGSAASDNAILKEINALALAIENCKTPVIAVSNELGMGVIPEAASTRRFTDLAGFMNQRMAKSAANAVAMISGIPMQLKKTS
ncbi:MAG: bifunctional adenosylcobinamide kinase/adenosylcobinamide-phosphate guanylyltransferase [Deltaproteobacteria bacterium]|nr:bifunctional adenosylcobinamide kinase/adenosylcobinamide-phosphate guanylyltransferase [Deltaproteobacteria bacterium]